MTQTEYEQNIIKKANARSEGTYDFYIEIDVDCEPLVEACDLEFTRSEDDDTQNEIALSLDKDEYMELTNGFNWALLNEQDIASMVLNTELGEYVTKVTIYKPNGDKICFS